MDERTKRLGWTRKWGWQMFNINLACGALSVVISTIPYTFRGQHAIGCIFFIANIVAYIVNVSMTAVRYHLFPRVWKNSFYDQKEAVWFPVVTVAMATILIGILLYGVPYAGSWLVIVCEVWFWIHIALAAITGLILQSTIRTIGRSASEIGPCDALEVYPLMFVGVAGSTLASELVKLDASRALTIAVFSYCFAGLGFFVGLMKLTVWMHEDMVLPTADSIVIPSNLISVGVPGFTALTLSNLIQAMPMVVEQNNFLSGLPISIDSTRVTEIISVTSIILIFLLLGMATWMLLVFLGWATLSFIRDPTRPLWDRWAFTWWGWTFPLTGIVLTFGRLATFLPSKAFGILNVIFVISMTLVFCVNVVGSVRMIWRGELPGSDSEYSETRIASERKRSDTSPA